MNAGKVSKKIALWGSAVVFVTTLVVLIYVLLVHKGIPQYEEKASPLTVVYTVLGLSIFAIPTLSILFGVIGLFGKEKKSAAFGIFYSLAFVCIAAFFAGYGRQPSGNINSKLDAKSKSTSSSNYDYFTYKIQSDTFKFIIPNGFGDATNAYTLTTQHPDLQFSLACYFTTIENLRVLASGKQVEHPNFVKIDILKSSKTNKVSKQEFASALKNVKAALPEDLKRSSIPAQESFKIKREQIKTFHGEDSEFEVVSTTNLGYIHSDDVSLLWTQLMPYELTIDGETNSINAMAVLGMFYLNGRAFYITSVREFESGTALQELEDWTVDYLEDTLNLYK
jgi:hypothetical protein